MEYSLLTASPGGLIRGEELPDLSSAETQSIISWKTSPNFEVYFNLDRLQRLAIPSALALLPSFVRPSVRRAPRKLSPTSYLDGLRGVAALFVMIHHYAYQYTATSPQGWHTGGIESNNWFFQLPLIRVVHSGRFMVAIFFVISGYVLSYRSLKLAREGRPTQLLDSLASSVFRRWLRLHLPVIVSTFIAFVLARYNLWIDMPFDWAHSSTGSYTAHKAIPFPIPTGSFNTQLRDWYEDAKQLCDPFRYGVVTASRYNINVLWTIPLEWMGSMLVFTTVLGIARTKTWVKFTVLSGLIYWCHSTTRWEPATFLSGILLAELSFVRAYYIDSSEPTELTEKWEPTKKLSRYLGLASRIFWTAVFMFGIYAGSHPQEGAWSTTGYQMLGYWIPNQYGGNREIFWLAIGGVLIVLALDNAPYLQRIFTTRFAQYLGDISFSLYMLHVQVMLTLGQWLVPKCMNLTGGWANGQLGFVIGMALALMVLVPFTFWVSDVFSRLVDQNCVKFARWMSSKCFINLK